MKPLDTLSHEELHRLTTDVYLALAAATKEYLEAKQELARSNYELDRVIAVGMHNGIIFGKNEKEREGHAHELHAEFFEAVERSQEHVWESEIKMQLAKLDETHLTTGIRIFELAAR